MADVQLDVSALDADQRVELVGFAPGEPTAKLVGVQLVRVAGVPGEIGHCGQLG